VIEHAPRGFFDAHAAAFEGAQECMGRRAGVAEVIVERIERHTAPDLTAVDTGFERDTRSSYDVTPAAEFNIHVISP
jgi:hypothetical protein